MASLSAFFDFKMRSSNPLVMDFQPRIVFQESNCTTVTRFVDTNVLLYAISGAKVEARKSEIARHILSQKDLALSVQVLQEFYVQATRPSHPSPITHQQATRFIQSLKRYPIVDVTMEVVEAAFSTKDRFHVSYWDAAIIEAARAAGSTILLTEDLSDGQNFGSVQIKNPFVVDGGF
jgi:predicted nucleic acid-binding protein